MIIIPFNFIIIKVWFLDFVWIDTDKTWTDTDLHISIIEKNKVLVFGFSHRSTSFVFINYLISLTILFPRSSVGTFFSHSSVE